MNSRLSRLNPYPFTQLRELQKGLTPAPGLEPINLGIGEPQHPTPPIIIEALKANLGLLGKYPPNGGTIELRTAISKWISRRYHVDLDPDLSILPVAGTREALFAFAQAALDPSCPGAVAMPNPFYQIYEGAAVLAGAEPVYIPTPAPDFLPSWSAVSESKWASVRLVYVCSPGNPAGAVLSLDHWKELFRLSDRFGFIIAADECYSEIYNGSPPLGALEAAQLLGRSNKGLILFNSLSKRSSAPGLRSGFVAGDPEIIQRFLQYRTFHGAAPSGITQAASVPAWNDEDHVEQSRSKYQLKFKLAAAAFPQVRIPDGGFFLWLPVEDDEEFARRAYVNQALTVLPGRYLAREVDGLNPGKGFVRVALVSEPAICEEAIARLRSLL